MTKRLLKFIFNRNRVKSALGLGFAFTLLILPLYIIDSNFTIVARAMIMALSPIYHWRFSHCMSLKFHNDPMWLFNVEAIAPFFIYGILLGYLINKPPKQNLNYIATTFICLAATTITLISTPLTNDIEPRLCQK